MSMENEEKEKTVGEILMEEIDKVMDKWSDEFNNLFIYGPDILNKTISEIKENKNEKDN